MTACTNCAPTEREIILRAEDVTGLMITLCAENADSSFHVAISETLHIHQCWLLRSLEVHPNFKGLVRKIAKEQFEEQYGAGYCELEQWRVLFGADADDVQERLPVVPVPTGPVPSFLVRRA